MNSLLWRCAPKPVRVFIQGIIPLWVLAMSGLIAEQSVLYSIPIAVWIMGFCIYSHYYFKKEENQ